MVEEEGGRESKRGVMTREEGEEAVAGWQGKEGGMVAEEGGREGKREVVTKGKKERKKDWERGGKGVGAKA